MRRLLIVCTLLLAGCATPPPTKPARAPEQIHAQLLQLLPARAENREGWAAAMTDAFVALQLDATTSHVCAALAVAEQESGFAVDPPVAGLRKIARAEIDRRADAHHVPQFMVNAALGLT